jgi:hypothetical protein
VRRALAISVLACSVFALGPGGADASPDPVEPTEPVEPIGPSEAPGTPGDADIPDTVPTPAARSDRRPLVEVPSGCLASPLPDVVFVGTLNDRDYRTARFRILQVRAGDPTPFAAGGLIDVRYGLDAQFLEVGERYLVSARRDPVLGVLASRLRPEAPMFGGDDIVGLVESEVVCPGFEDPARTLYPDGSIVETSVVGPLLERRGQLLASLVVPFAVAFGVIFVLASLRLSVTGLARGVGTVAARTRR